MSYQHRRRVNTLKKTKRYYNVDCSNLADFNWQLPQSILTIMLSKIADDCENKL